jgi:hypothetical protein
MSQHDDYKFSITIHSDDLPMVAAIRGLAWFCQETGNKQIAWGGTKKPDWIKNEHRVTFHFDRPLYRKNFLDEITRLFPAGWTKMGERDDDPAEPQNSR